MEGPVDEKDMCLKEPLLLDTPEATGGFKTLPSIIVNESLEKIASYGLSSNMTRYLTGDYGMSTAGASYVLSFWSAASNFTPMLGAFLADSSVGRYPMIGFGSITCFLGMLLLWLTAALPGARPFCHKFRGYCESSTPSQLLLLYSSFALMAVGAGGLRSSSLAFGADQLKKRGSAAASPRIFESYVSWYYVSVTASVLIGMSVVVYIQDTMGWKVGFGIPVVLMFLSVFSFFLASSFYVKAKPTPSLITGLLQVAVASYKKRNIRFSPDDSDVMYHSEAGSTRLIPSQKLRFLNRACIIRNPRAELTMEGRVVDPWSLCTVDRVAELKALINIIPIWSTGIIFAASMTPNSVSYLQLASMDRHITSNFEVPAGSFGSFLLVSIVIWIPLYDRLLLPLASKIIGKPVRVDVQLRIVIGIIFICLSGAVSAIVESHRRALAIEEGLSDDPHAVVNMSAFWLLPCQVFSGLAEAFNVIGQNEFYLSKLPASMSSIATTLVGLSMFSGNMIAGFIMTCVDNLSKSGGKESWVSSNINKGHFDYYHWLLCGLNAVNFFYFLVCSKLYGRCKDEEANESSKDEID